METVLIILAVATGCWEVIARVVPTVNNWAGTAIVLRVLTFLSELLNRKKQVK